MSTKIISTGVSLDNTLHSAIKHAVHAANVCINKAGIDIQEIDYLINVGVYRDDNLIEPSIAALIQKQLGLNLDYVKHPVERAAFSFDLMNGGGGVLNAMQVADALFATDRAKYILITSSDAHPASADAKAFPFTEAGGAILLASSDDPDKGLQACSFYSSDDDYVGTKTYVDYQQQGLNSKSDITIKTDINFEAELLNFTFENCRSFLIQNNINPTQVLLIASQISSQFVSSLGQKLEIPDQGVMKLHDRFGDPHTSSFALGLDCNGTSLSSDNHYEYILFVGAGAGIQCGCALYKI